MKKIISIILSLVILTFMALPVYAAGMEVKFTSSSSFKAGGTVTADKTQTCMSIMDDSSCTSDEYNAALERQISFYWYKNGNPYKDGASITLTNNDMGSTFYCQATLYSDADCVVPCGSVKSKSFTVPKSIDKTLIPKITTKSLAEATVGKEYAEKLECTNSDVAYSIESGSLPEGFTLTQHGEIEGTPLTAGTYKVVIKATPEDLGKDYATTAEFELVVKEAEKVATESVTEPTDEVTSSDVIITDGAITTDNSSSLPVWVVPVILALVIITIAVIVIAIIIVVIFFVVKKRK